MYAYIMYAYIMYAYIMISKLEPHIVKVFPCQTFHWIPLSKNGGVSRRGSRRGSPWARLQGRRGMDSRRKTRISPGKKSKNVGDVDCWLSVEWLSWLAEYNLGLWGLYLLLDKVLNSNLWLKGWHFVVDRFVSRVWLTISRGLSHVN